MQRFERAWKLRYIKIKFIIIYYDVYVAYVDHQEQWEVWPYGWYEWDYAWCCSEWQTFAYFVEK